MHLKTLFISIVCIFAISAVTAQDSVRVKELEKKIERLEVRLARVESMASEKKVSSEAKKMIKVVEKREKTERKKYKAEDIAKADQWYFKASRNMYNEDSQKLLDSVVSVYPYLNRAGCAQLYLAQQKEGTEKERLLKDCIDRFYTCYYLDGAQVGPLAMLRLADYYRYNGKSEDAIKLYKKIKHDCPKAVGHDGRLLKKYLSKYL